MPDASTAPGAAPSAAGAAASALDNAASAKPIILVCGFGRCGSSLVMQMLEAAGVPVTGRWPAFEADEANIANDRLDPAWLARIPGHAVKLLDPHKIAIPRGHYRAIWLDRDHDQQARSQMKFASLMFGLSGGRRQRRAFEGSYARDLEPAVRALWRAGTDKLLTLKFETLIYDPCCAAAQLAEFAGLRAGAVASMARAVRPRSAACAPGQDLELQLVRERGRSPARAAHV